MQKSTCGSLPEDSEPELDAELDEAALGDLLGVRARADGLFEEAEGSWVSGLTGPFTWASPPPNAKFVPVGIVPVCPLAFTTLKAVTCLRKRKGHARSTVLLSASPGAQAANTIAALCSAGDITARLHKREGFAACSLWWSLICLRNSAVL